MEERTRMVPDGIGSVDPASRRRSLGRFLFRFGSDLQPSSKLDRLSEPDGRVRELARPRSCCTSNAAIPGEKRFLGRNKSG